MRHLLSVTLLFFAVLTARADDMGKPNTLTPKEIADGWILLFDGETTLGWRVEGDAKVSNGILVLGGEKETKVTTLTEFNGHRMAFKYLSEGEKSPTFEAVGGERSSMGLGVGEGWVQSKWEFHEWGDLKGGGFMPLDKEVGSGFETKVDKPGSAHRFALSFQIPAGTKLSVRDLKLEPYKLKPLFNSKDFSGWKEFPGKKTKFSITKEGWLNLKDGPGDLQTEAQFADFILQLDCISNGKHCNSGVFFRCKPGEYQQGYEAQIHNHFTAEPAKEYAIEEFDPKTNMLKETKKVKYAAVDYGTGAIYRRIPARKEVAKDGEWFTMTVIANGRHIATWVNGIQVVDWTDNRPIKDNARNGCRLEKGPISLQGHDPTTDLSFRNIRIAELPAVKTEK